jgi:hypothetical protein
MHLINKRSIVTSIAIMLTVVFLLSGCAKTPPASTASPTGPAPTDVTQQPAIPASQTPDNQSPITAFSSTPQVQPSASASPAITPETTGESMPGGIGAHLNLSKAPAAGETVDLSYIINWPGGPLKSLNRVWLKFERYDPSLYYPLGKGQRIKDKILSDLSKMDPESGVYFTLSMAAQAQPESAVPIESVVVSGNTQWEGSLLNKGDQVKLEAQVQFPEEGEWIINALSRAEDGSVRVDRDIYLTVNKDSGMMGFPDTDPEGHLGYNFARPELPVGVFARIDRAPLFGETAPIWVTIQSITDLEAAEVTLEVYNNKHKVPANEVIISGKDIWKGSLKKGEPVQFSCEVKFPSEGNWLIWFIARGNQEEYGDSMFHLPIYVDKEHSRFEWPASDETSLTDQIVQDEKEKAKAQK